MFRASTTAADVSEMAIHIATAASLIVEPVADSNFSFVLSFIFISLSLPSSIDILDTIRHNDG